MDDVLNQIAEMYTESLAEHGCTAEGVGWGDAEQHLLRLEKLTAALAEDAPTEPLTLNDLGCGFGSLFRYVDSLDTVHLGSYYGYDISSDMIEAARKKIEDDRACFIESDELQTNAHYTVASGIFNVKMDVTDDEWQAYVERTLEHMAEHSSRGIMFNSLTSHVDWKEDHLFYGDPAYFVDLCARTISRDIVLLHDYSLYEWTIIVHFAS